MDESEAERGVKSLTLSPAAPQEKRLQLMNELRLLCDGSTAGVRGMIRYFGAYFSPESSAIKVALEYMDAGSLESLLGTVGPFPEGILARIAADVLDGLAWLHGVKGLVHRDIKPGNILMNSRGEPKLSDFGISTALELDTGAQAAGGGHSLGRSVRNGVTGAQHGRSHGTGGGLTSHPWGSRGNLPGSAAASVGMEPSGRGTLCYMSPERLSSQPYGFSADLWSLGMTLLVCATGLFPYATDAGPVGTMLEILDCNPLSHRPEVAAATAALSPACLAFLAACLSRDPTRRPSAAQARASPWACTSAAPHASVAAFLAHSAQGGDPASPSRAAAQAAMAAFESLAQMFAAHYYRLLDAPRGEGDATWHGALGGIYAAHAQLTLVRGGEPACSESVHGPAGICLALAAGGETSHTVGQLDCQPLQCGGGQGADGVLVHASGTVVVAFEQRRFAEVFTLVPGSGDDGRWFVVNHWRREWTM